MVKKGPLKLKHSGRSLYMYWFGLLGVNASALYMYCVLGRMIGYVCTYVQRMHIYLYVCIYVFICYRFISKLSQNRYRLHIININDPGILEGSSHGGVQGLRSV